ncbi:hypothetical protein [Deinococcus ruber]|uniref:Uncharacterized protein n=1 Tax=Deinococcus ruber TaxID=1848197 RepID=A0A918FAY5_9DEIO|nr:hypothetical protein [Deinococcus ruber]GGR17401.1 hypothetical protein GCM10008957_32600 [Deinococcus ruber]
MWKLLVVSMLMLGTARAVTYTEPQRLKIWAELSAADAKAAWTADATYPERCGATVAQMNRHAALSDRLAAQWQQVVVQKYKLTKQQVVKLLYEGADKHWPEAAYPPPSC